jgi:hypothetical protein
MTLNFSEIMHIQVPKDCDFVTSFHPQMALFRNLDVKLQGCLCDVPRYASAQPLVFLDLAENCSFLHWKLTLMPIEFYDSCMGTNYQILYIS